MHKFVAYTIIGLQIQKTDLKISDDDYNIYIHNYTKLDNVEGELKINDTIYRVTKFHADDNFHYILLYEGCSDNNEKCPYSLEQLSEMKDKMKLNLQVINLWDEAKFGIYTGGHLFH